MDKEFIGSKDNADRNNDVFASKDRNPISGKDHDKVNGNEYNYSVAIPTMDDDYGSRIDVRGGTFLGKPWDESGYTPRSFMDDEVELFSNGRQFVAKEARDTKPATLTDLIQESSSGMAPTAISGSLDMPNIRHDIDKSSLFIDNTTSVADVRQGNVGDCYFLAAIMSIVQKDPAFFTRMMKLSNNTVSTTFYHQTGTIFNRKWTPVTIQTPYGIAHRNGQKIGSDYRISEHYKSKWYAKFEETILSLNQDNYYQAALWVNCIEQAFTVFASNYGQFGKGKDWFDNKERYDRIDGGFAGECLQMFYGDKASGNTLTHLAAPSDKRDILKDNKSVIKNLLSFKRSQNDMQNNVHVFASTTKEQALERVQYHSKKALNEFNTRFATLKASASEEDKGKIPELEKAKDNLEVIYNCAQNYDAKPKTGFIFTRNNPLYQAGETEKTYQERMKNTMNIAANELRKNAAYQSLNLDSYTDLKIAVAGHVQIKRQSITIMTNHAYTIQDVDFVDTEGKSLNEKNVEDVIANADIESSRVTLRNPHGQNKKVYNGEREEKLAEGGFDMNLHEFLVGVGRLQMATSSHA